MASFQENRVEPKSDNNLPLVLIHKLPLLKVSFNHWIESKFRLLEPSDPSFSTLALSVRVMLCVAHAPVTSDTFDQFPSLECVVGSTAGIDHIDLHECRRRGVKVTGAGDVYSEDVADYAIGLLIDVLRRVSAADRFVRAGLWPVKGDYPLGLKLGGKRVGILGLGSIGSMIAKRLESFGCIIAYTSRKKKPNVPFTFYTSALDLASNSDVLIVCCTLTDKTHHIINMDVMLALGKKGVIINVGRGPLIDEKELVKFLGTGDILGAGFDVYENEPIIPEELFVLDNVVLSPHRAIATSESFENLRELIVWNLDAFFENRPLRAEVKLE